MLGEIGRLDDVVFIETTQIAAPVGTDTADLWPGLPGGNVTTPNPTNPDWRLNALGITEAQRAAEAALNPSLTNYDETLDPFADIAAPTGSGAGADAPPGSVDTYPMPVPTPGWGEPWGPGGGIYEAIMLGDNAFGHAVSLPVELRDGGVLDFGREHALAWYSIWGWGVITESSVVKMITN
jgi:hypothetical protein